MILTIVCFFVALNFKIMEFDHRKRKYRLLSFRHKNDKTKTSETAIELLLCDILLIDAP